MASGTWTICVALAALPAFGCGASPARTSDRGPPDSASGRALLVAPPPRATSQTEPTRVEKEPEPRDEDEVLYCSFEAGSLVSCRPYSGTVYLFDAGAWVSCRVTASRVTHCTGPGNGRVVFGNGSSFVSCIVTNGSLGPCSPGFTGSAPLARPHE